MILGTIAATCLTYLNRMDHKNDAWGVDNVRSNSHLYQDLKYTIYIRSINEMGEIHTSFIMGKARLAPLKSVSIPRLELLAATLAVKVQRTVKHELGLIYDDVYYWTDSTTVLYYLRNQEKRYKIFVANRVAAIRDEIIRVGGRLQHAPISSDERHQIILPSKHHISNVIIRHYHTSNGSV